MSSDEEHEPKHKKAKKSKTVKKAAKKDSEDEDEDASEEEEGESGDLDFKKNADGEAYVDLSDNRRLTVRSFKGKTLVDIREFYEKGGKKLPGKKGISLNVEQYEALRDLIKNGKLEEQVVKQGKL